MKNVIITGASSGIGAALAGALDTGGYRLILSGRSMERLEKLSASLTCEHQLLKADVTSYDACRSLIDLCIQEYGQVHVMVNNAGLGIFDPLEEGKIEDWHEMIDVNVKGVLNCLHAAIPSLIESRGHVINIGSIASHFVFPESGVYCASKHALWGISESIRIELMGRVKVTTVSPGPVDTDFVNKTENEEIRTKLTDYFKTGIKASTIAQQIKHAIESPDDAVINEILLRPFRE